MEQNVYNDCWQLLQRFVSATDKSGNADFELFCQCWHDLQFQHIYTAQTNHVEVIETTLAALHVAKRVACGRRTFGEPFAATRTQRIGGIYLLYAIYNKQPTKSFIKIEVSLRTWQTLVSFVEQLRFKDLDRRDTQQVSYIFWQLVQANAFRHTALDYCQGLDGLTAYDSVERFVAAKRQKIAVSEQALHNIKLNCVLLNEEMHELKDLEEVCKPLCQLEEAYNKQMTPHRASFAPTKIFSQLQEVFHDINKLLLNETYAPTSTSDPNSQLQLRQCIRQKARIGEEKHAMSIDEELTRDQPVTESRDQRLRRMSSATVFRCKLPDDVITNLKR